MKTNILHKLLFVMIAMMSTMGAWAQDNVITYECEEKIDDWALYEAFGASVDSHEFENGIGTITFYGDVTEIKSGAFTSTGITSITLPNSVTKIGDNAFNECSSLSSITFPSSLETIGNNAFYGCM